MIKDAICRAFEKKRIRGWEKYPRLFIAIDLHDVIIPGTYTLNNEGRKLYPFADSVLKWMTNRTDICMILYTSSHPKSIEDILFWLGEKGIVFDYVNENPECPNTELCDFKKKMYFDVLLEDKAGFNGKEDWIEIMSTLQNIGEWDKKTSHEEKIIKT